MAAWFGSWERITDKMEPMPGTEAALCGSCNFTSKPKTETYL